MFSNSTDIYDAIYLPFKDYESEVDVIDRKIRGLLPKARTILDVACGTGQHALHLAARGYAIDGVDIEPEFVRIAQAKVPNGRFVQADMTEFSIGRAYDAVICLFSSIGYVQTVSNLKRAIKNMAAHVSRGGILLVEPWFVPGFLQDGKVSMHTGMHAGFPVCRMSHVRLADRISTLHFEYLIGTEGGVERRSEEHKMGLFSVREMISSFESAGLGVTFEEGGLPMGRGLYIGRKP